MAGGGGGLVIVSTNKDLLDMGRTHTCTLARRALICTYMCV